MFLRKVCLGAFLGDCQDALGCMMRMNDDAAARITDVVISTDQGFTRDIAGVIKNKFPRLRSVIFLQLVDGWTYRKYYAGSLGEALIVGKAALTMLGARLLARVMLEPQNSLDFPLIFWEDSENDPWYTGKLKQQLTKRKAFLEAWKSDVDVRLAYLGDLGTTPGVQMWMDIPV